MGVWDWWQSFSNFLFTERVGYRRPSTMTADELAFRERALLRLDELERVVGGVDARLAALESWRTHGGIR